MNYTLEDGIDFFEELQKALEEDNDNLNKNIEYCLISKQPLIKNQTIILDCGHKFNYHELYKEVKQQKNRVYNNLESTKLFEYQLKCPYCRNVQNKILPFISGFKEITSFRGVTKPSQYCMEVNKCSYKFKSGKRKGQMCGKDTLCDFCHIHNKDRSVKKKQFNIHDVDYNSLEKYLKQDLTILAKHLSLKNYSKLNKKQLISYIIKSKK